MPSYGLEEYSVVFVGITLECLIAAIMLRRKLHVAWPGFFAYNIFHAFQPFSDLVGILRKWPQFTYFYFFYTLEAISLALSFVVIYEVFLTVLEPYEALSRVARKIFFVTAATLLLVAVLFVFFGPGSEGNRLFKLVFYTERSLRIVQIGLLMLLFFLARSFGLSWRSNAFGIALGYGIYSTLQLVLVVLRLQYVNFNFHLISTFSALSFILMSVIWLRFVAQPVGVAQPIRAIPYNDIAKWNEKLEELLKPKTATKNDVEEEENDDQPVSR